MTKETMQKAMMILATAYPKYYANMDNKTKWEQLELYAEMFRDVPEEAFSVALRNYVMDNEFPPTVAGLNKEIKKITGAVVPEQDIEAYVKESWAAVCGSKSFSDLSPVCQEYWGSQAAIDAVGFDEGTMYTVVKAQLERRLPEIIERQKTREQVASVPGLSEVVRRALGQDEPRQTITAGESALLELVGKIVG